MSGTKHSDLVRVDWRGNIAILTMNIGGNGNGLTAALRRALYEALNSLNNQEERCRAIILTGPPDSFSAGSGSTSASDAASPELDADSSLALDIFQLLATGRRPVVAAIQGAASGVGLSLALACDYVVGTADGRFSCAFDTNGQRPEGGFLWALARRIGAGRAREAILSARQFSAQEALEVGLVSEVVGPGEALEKAYEVASRYAGMPPLALAWLKVAMATGSDTLDQAIETETNIQPLLRFTADHSEAVEAFLQKRTPVFVGR